jgi:hypothetical protein
MNAMGAGLIGGSRDHPTRLGRAAHHYWPAAQLGLVELLDRGKEGIEIGMDNAAGHATKTMMLHSQLYLQE